MIITSPQNPLIKYLCKLREKARFRKKEQCFLVEGVREIDLAILGGYDIKRLIFDKGGDDTVQKITTKNHCKTVAVPPALYKKIAVRGTTEGIIAVFKMRETALKNLTFQKENPLILIAESIEKPGNMGAIFRTADALGVDAVLLANTKIDPYNPHVIRASLGCAFTVPVVADSNENIQQFLKEKQIKTYAATPMENSKNYTDVDFNSGTAIVLGNEAIGLSPIWLHNDTVQKLIIPMRGKINSMNISVAAAIMVAEVVRQRNDKK